MTNPSVRIVRARVSHVREIPRRNAFSYRVFYLSVPISLDPYPKTPGLLSINARNILSFRSSDYGPRDGTSLYTWIVHEFRNSGVTVEPDDTIELITHPRMFGYVFNPISFWMLSDTASNLIAVLCEVHNTFGDTHNYVLAHDDRRAIAPTDVFTAPKHLYVSPFNTTLGHYLFSFTRTPEIFQAAITYSVHDTPTVKTMVKGAYGELSLWRIAAIIFSYPLMTIAIVMFIHWQALRLLLKGVPHTLRSKPGATQGGTTRGHIRE